MTTNPEPMLTTLIASARLLATFARRAGRYDEMRRARHIGTTLDACLSAFKTENSDSTVAVAFASSAFKLLNAIERELWNSPVERPHFADVSEQLDALGIELLPWQLHAMRRYFA